MRQALKGKRLEAACSARILEIIKGIIIMKLMGDL